MEDPRNHLSAQQRKAVDHVGGTVQVHNTERRKKLNDVVQVYYKRFNSELGPYFGFETSYHDEDTRVTIKASKAQEDGTNLVYVVRIYLGPDDVIRTDDVTVEIDSYDEFWKGKLRYLDTNHPQHHLIVRAGHHHYYIGEERNEPSSWKGFGGREWRVEFLDGRIVETDNLWSQGVIPPKWRDALSDNAKLIDVTGEKLRKISEAFKNAKLSEK